MFFLVAGWRMCSTTARGTTLSVEAAAPISSSPRLGTDTLTWQGLAGPISANLTTGLATGTGIDHLSAIEVLLGSAGVDTLIGDEAANRLEGSDGNDHLAGRAGNDILDGGAGVDFLDGGADTDSCLEGETVQNCEA